MTKTTPTYTIKREYTLVDDLRQFLNEELPKVCKLFDNKYDFNYARIRAMLSNGVFFVCRRDGKVTGIHVSWLISNPFDVRVKSLSQALFYVKPDSGRTAYHLFQKFIDFGRSEADHINTTIGKHTNIKPSTLKRLGFSEVETMYQMKVRHE